MSNVPVLSTASRCRIFSVLLVLGVMLPCAAREPDPQDAFADVPRQGTPRRLSAREVFSGDGRVAVLAEAAASGEVEDVKRLVREGVPVDAVGSKHVTPLFYALKARNIVGAEALLRLGASPNNRIDLPQYIAGCPMLLLLVGTGMTDEVELLLKFGADPNAREPVRANVARSHPYEGDSALILAVTSVPDVRVLLKYGANVNIRPQERYSAAIAAATLGQLDVLEILLARGAQDLDEVAFALQRRPWSPRVRPQRLKILRELHGRGAKIYANAANQDTPAELLSPGEWKYRPYVGDTPVQVPK